MRHHASSFFFVGLLLTNIWSILLIFIEPRWWNVGGLDFHFYGWAFPEIEVYPLVQDQPEVFQDLQSFLGFHAAFGPCCSGSPPT